MFDKGVSNFRATTHELTMCGDCKNDEEVSIPFRLPHSDHELTSTVSFSRLQVVDALVENAGKHDFTFGRLTSLSENLGCSYPYLLPFYPLSLSSRP